MYSSKDTKMILLPIQMPSKCYRILRIFLLQIQNIVIIFVGIREVDLFIY